MSYILDALRRADAERERGAVPGLHAQPNAAVLAQAQPRGVLLPLGWVLAGLLALLAAGGAAWWWLRPAALPPVVAAGPAVPDLPSQPPAVANPPMADTPTPPVLPDAAGMAGAADGQKPRAATVPGAASTPLTGRTAAGTAAGVPATKPTRNPPAGASRVPSRGPDAGPTSDPSPLAGIDPTTGLPIGSGGQAAGNKPAASASANANAEPHANPTSAANPVTRLPTLAELPEDLRRQVPALTVGGSVYSPQASQRMVIFNGQLFHEGDRLSGDLMVEQIRQRSVVLRVRGQRFELPL